MNYYIKNVCKIGQGDKCCKYLIAGVDGFECAKVSSLKNVIDDNWGKHEHVAQGDNCAGQIHLATMFDEPKDLVK